MKRTLLILIFLMSCCITATANDAVEAYFYHLKSLEFEKAKLAVSALSNERLKLELYRLSDILFYEGQTERSGLRYPKTNNKPEKGLTKAVYLLSEGYLSLFYDKIKGNAYKNFYEAYQIAQDINYRYLIKASLLAILKYYKFEISQNSKDQYTYLNEFKKIRDDELDMIWITIYEMIFYSKTMDEDLDPNYIITGEKLDDYEKSLPPDHRILSYIFYENAIKYKVDEQYDLAKKYYAKTIAISGNHPFLKKNKFFSYIDLSHINMEEKDAASGFRHIDSARKHIDLADTLRSDYYINAYSAFLYDIQKKHDTAFALLFKAYIQDLTLNYRQNTTMISRVNADNEKDQLEANIEKQQTQKRNILIGSIVLILLGGSIAMLLQNNTAKKRKIAEQQQQLEKQKVETLIKEQELISIDAMIAGQEKERQRVAHELHDDLGSLMATIKLHFDNIKASKEDPALKQTHKLLDQAYQKIRGISHAKNSGVMASQGLLPAIQKMAGNITATNALEIEVLDFGLEDRMENTLELTIFRIVQELITNVVKHADATKASIQLTQHETSLNLIIEDNGKGFDISKIDASDTGMGLRSIEKRIEHLEGVFTIESAVNKGTTIIIDIPT